MYLTPCPPLSVTLLASVYRPIILLTGTPFHCVGRLINTASKRTFSSFQFHTPRKSGMYSVFSLLRVINTNFEVALINIPPEDLRLHFCHCQQLVGIFSCSL